MNIRPDMRRSRARSRPTSRGTSQLAFASGATPRRVNANDSFGVLGDEADVEEERDGQAGADGGTVDRADDRRRHLPVGVALPQRVGRDTELAVVLLVEVVAEAALGHVDPAAERRGRRP